MPPTLWIESNEVWVAEGAQVIWHGKPEGYAARSVVGLPGTEDAVVLLEYEAGPRCEGGRIRGWPNLVRLRPNGEIVWRAAAVDAEDSWVAVGSTTEGLIANTWSCYAVKLDPETGLQMSKVFTK